MKRPSLNAFKRLIGERRLYSLPSRQGIALLGDRCVKMTDNQSKWTDRVNDNARKFLTFVSEGVRADKGERF